jgi:hypothetical protein
MMQGLGEQGIVDWGKMSCAMPDSFGKKKDQCPHVRINQADAFDPTRITQTLAGQSKLK